MAQLMSKSATCSDIASNRITMCSPVVNHLGSRCRPRILSIMSSRVPAKRYRFSNCLARIICNTEENIRLRLRYRRI